MGVLGLTPFLRRTCPEVIKQLPDRLKGLAGKTIVIDGTLITQRFYFAQVVHPFRHVLGWHRLATELKDAGVGAICVFDGKERNLAKQREVLRRREIQRQAVARGNLELGRLQRLQALAGVLEEFKNLRAEERKTATIRLRQLTSVSEEEFIQASSAKSFDEGPAPLIATNAEREELLHQNDDHLAYAEGTNSDAPAWDSKHTSQSLVTTRDAEPRSEFSDDSRNDRLRPAAWEPNPIAHEAEDQGICPNIDIHLDIPSELPDHTPPALSIDEISSALESLYVSYRTSNKSSPATHSIPPQEPSISTQQVAAAYGMTKIQQELSVEEAKLWDELVQLDSNGPEQPDRSPVKTLFALAERSSVISESFQRRTNLPTTRTYDESREMIEAFGIPCLQSSSPFEGEALASALVLNGQADFVASEDTDVLVYEAPLLRNITNRNAPLDVISGVEICNALKLSRECFVDFALLLGTDFSQRIKNVGPSRALRFLQEHGSIEQILILEKKHPPRNSKEEYMQQIEAARNVFRTLPPVPEVQLLKAKEEDAEKILEIVRRYDLENEIRRTDWDFSNALQGNLFGDDPFVRPSVQTQ